MIAYAIWVAGFAVVAALLAVAASTAGKDGLAYAAGVMALAVLLFGMLSAPTGQTEVGQVGSVQVPAYDPVSCIQLIHVEQDAGWVCVPRDEAG